MQHAVLPSSIFQCSRYLSIFCSVAKPVFWAFAGGTIDAESFDEAVSVNLTIATESEDDLRKELLDLTRGSAVFGPSATV